MTEVPFWRRKSLAEMTPAEWESLCDGCGRCCLLKLEDEDTGEVVYTDVACRLLDPATCRCRDYPRRRRQVPDCVVLNAENLERLDWMPSTCAYRLLHRGEELPVWHPLVCGNRDEVHRASMSARDRVVPEDEVADEDLEEHVVAWPA